MCNSCVKSVSACQEGAVDVLGLFHVWKEVLKVPVDGCKCLDSVWGGSASLWVYCTLTMAANPKKMVRKRHEEEEKLEADNIFNSAAPLFTRNQIMLDAHSNRSAMYFPHNF